MKAPRYKGENPWKRARWPPFWWPTPKASPECKALVDVVLKKLGVGPEALFSTLGRTAARGIESAIIAGQDRSLAEPTGRKHQEGRHQDLPGLEDAPSSDEGVGFVNAPRGALKPLDEHQGR